MEPLEFQYDNMEAVPEAFRPLYADVNGKAQLSFVKGVKHETDVNTVKEALRKERADHDAVKKSFAPWSTLKHDEVTAKLARIEELEAAAAGKIDEKKLEEIVGNRVKQKVDPLNITLGEKDKAIAEREAKILELTGQITDRNRNEAVRAAATKSKVHATAVSDVERAAADMMEFDEDGKLVTKANIPGIAAGLDADGFLKAMFDLRPHWWPESMGGGAGGGGPKGGSTANNPWSAAHWNVTEQGKVTLEKGRAHAEALAKSAGSFFGAMTPPAKK